MDYLGKLLKNAHKIKPAFGGFSNRHDNFIKFFKSFENKPIKTGCIVSILVQNPDGSVLARTNFKVSESDMEAFHKILG